MELTKVKNKKNQETDGYSRDKRPSTKKTKTEGNNDNWKLEETETEKKSRNAVRVFVKSVRRGVRCLWRVRFEK